MDVGCIHLHIRRYFRYRSVRGFRCDARRVLRGERFRPVRRQHSFPDVDLRKVLILLALIPAQAFAQRTISSDVVAKQVFDGKVITTHKHVWCSSTGVLVSSFSLPKSYISVQTMQGNGQLYFAESNSVYNDNSGAMSCKDELLYIFLTGGVYDMGLSQYGYKLKSSDTDSDGYVKRTYTCNVPGAAPVAELVTKNYLPVYLAHKRADGKVMGKLFLSNYVQVGRLSVPARTTEIVYKSAKDSIVVRTDYKNLIADDKSDPLGGFQVPSDAKVLQISPVK